MLLAVVNADGNDAHQVVLVGDIDQAAELLGPTCPRDLIAFFPRSNNQA